MSAGRTPQPLAVLILRCLEGTAGDHERRQLQRRLQDDPAARQQYAEWVGLVGLLQHSGVSLLSSLPTTDPQAQERLRQIERYAESQLQAYLAEQHPEDEETLVPSRPRWDPMAAVKNLLEGLVRWIGVTWSCVRVGTFLATLVLVVLLAWAQWQSYLSVGQVGQSLQAGWREPPGETLQRWQRLSLTTGYAQLQLESGAAVLLQAPCRIKLLSPRRLALESGTLTVRVPPPAEGFTVTTPGAVVKDFGTEFGVLVTADDQSEVYVFDGRVGLSSARPSVRSRPQDLTEGQSALADASGGLHPFQSRYGPQHFRRTLPSDPVLGIPGRRLDLGDLVGGGNGFGTGRFGGGWSEAGGSLNPWTGRLNDPNRPGTPVVLEELRGREALRYDRYHHPGPKQFVPVPEVPAIDGVFVPDGGEGPVVISSAGHVFAECPDTDGLTKWNIINGWRYRGQNYAVHIPTVSPDDPGLSLLANIGITFDLAQIRRTLPGVRIAALTAQAGVPFRPNPDRSDLELWVLVDGHVRFHRTKVHYPQMVPVHVPLTPVDRFLTLAVTDGQTPSTQSVSSHFDWSFWQAASLLLDSRESF